jgi:hypothetical protein
MSSGNFGANGKSQNRASKALIYRPKKWNCQCSGIILVMKDLSPKLEISNLHQTERLEMAIGRLGYELISLKFEVKKLNKTILEANEKNDKLIQLKGYYYYY